jgi:hypothetical protein
VESWLKRVWARVGRRRPVEAFYPDEDRKAGDERRELVDRPKHAADDFPSGDAARQFPSP